MFDKLKNLFKKPEPSKVIEPPKVKKKSQPRKPKEKKTELSEKEKATLAGEPYISIIKVDVNPSNINAGSFELDWNDKFVINLVKAGYKQREEDTDQVVVDRWFQTVCRNIALEVYEQQASDPKNSEYDELRRVQSKDIGNGRTEIS
jgi:hypothetical protein